MVTHTNLCASQRGMRVWTIPAERMKAKREHRVPLATQTIQVLANAQRLVDGSGLIFRRLPDRDRRARIR